MIPRSIRCVPSRSLFLATAVGLVSMAAGCDGKPETGTQVSDELVKAQEDSARAAEEYVKEQRKKK